ncbi:MAG: hypothetical protein JZU47_10210 [Prolixibacteraceae bacterium]|nr:hypothetical protein [Prolixibacteraceae bacterium]
MNLSKPFRLFLFSIFLLPFCSGLSAQEVTNIRIGQQDDKVVINYDITNARASQTFDVKVICSPNGGNNYSIYPKLLTGDLNMISAGKDKSIVWDVINDGHELSGNNYVFLLELKVYEKSVERNYTAQKITTDNIYEKPVENSYTRKKVKSDYFGDYLVGGGGIYSEGSTGGEFFLLNGRKELVLGFADLTPFRDIGYANYSSISCSITLGYSFPKILWVTPHAGWGVRMFTDKNNTDNTQNFNCAVLGATIPIKLGSGWGIYAKADYWTSSELDPFFQYGVGLFFY